MTTNIQRRRLLSFLGYGWISAQLGHSFALGATHTATSAAVIHGIQASRQDALVLADGLRYELLIKWRDPINSQQRFGTHCDYVALLAESEQSAILWVNHESFRPIFVSGAQRSKSNIDTERKEVGGSILRVKREGDRWQFIRDDDINKRIDASTKIPFSLNTVIKDSNLAEGTLANCAGGVTPWSTFLSCEENYHSFYGDFDAKSKKNIASVFKWDAIYPNPPEHYGWVVEIDPHTQSAKKHVTLGRFAHESATCVVSKHGNTIVYSGDDKNDECLYKFVADKPNTLESGTLYVADTVNGKWLALDWQHSKILQKNFKDQIEVYVYARHAASLLGATPLDRPEDIKINPITGDVFMSLTNNIPRANFHGKILKLMEKDGDYEALEFSTETFLTGGASGFSSPDNIQFDQQGNLWFCSDISGKAMHKLPYTKFKNNGLFVVPAKGPQAGEVIQLASAPNDAELTGLCFDPQQKTLFLSVQHPGDLTTDLNNPTSRWPNNAELPASAVVQISGPLLQAITGA